MKTSPVLELVSQEATCSSRGLLEIKTPAVHQGDKLCKDSLTENLSYKLPSMRLCILSSTKPADLNAEMLCAPGSCKWRGTLMSLRASKLQKNAHKYQGKQVIHCQN